MRLAKAFCNPYPLFVPVALLVHYFKAMPGTALMIGMAIGWLTNEISQIWRHP
jgi:hypothetical protein